MEPRSDPAFARPFSMDPEEDIAQEAQEGLSIRDYFAAAALTGILAAYDADSPLPAADVAAGSAYEYADAMLAERDK